MTTWSPWFTDLNDVQISLQSGPAEVYGDSTFPGTGPVDSAAFTYTRGAATSIGGGAAPTEAATIGVDCASMFAGPFSPVAHTDAIPDAYRPLWDGHSWRWETPYGTVPADATATFVLDATGSGGVAFDGECYMWLDDDMDFSSGHMTGPEFDAADLMTRWSASPAKRHFPLTIGAHFITGITLTIPVSVIVARGYKFAVTVGVSSDSTGGLDLGDPDHESILDSFFVNPRFSIGLTALPPQRQFPRDDGLGISTRRSWPPNVSKQHGLRRGTINTYQ